ncbi:MAG: alpha/beta hydrolase [Marinosulfonomonas sp.]|nr:alpha/beta hydrolase [Marinosulfonomonas sp.]
MEKAPLFNDIAKGPQGGKAFWLTADDGIRIRAAYWPGKGKGTILLLPGRCEYVEKYGRAAGELAAHGYGTISIDWRGQGLADRLAPLATLGHVDQFSDYQKDLRAVFAMAEMLDCPKPFYLIAHSMGGCIALRALNDGLAVNAAVLTAPMWRLPLKPAKLALAWALSWAVHGTRFGQQPTPGTTQESYVLSAPFQGNDLTTNPEYYADMQRDLRDHAELALGGPSLNWLYEALRETRALRSMPPPPVPTLTFLGSDETIVDPGAIHQVMDNWPNGELRMVEGAEHEVMMEIPAIQRDFFNATAQHFAQHS